MILKILHNFKVNFGIFFLNKINMISVTKEIFSRIVFFFDQLCICHLRIFVLKKLHLNLQTEYIHN